MMLMLKMLVLKMVKKYINMYKTNWVFLAGMTQNKQKGILLVKFISDTDLD